MIRRLNRVIKDSLRPIRLYVGKKLFDRKSNKNYEYLNNGKLNMDRVKSILILRYDGKIGDMVVNTLMFREIKKNYPNIKIGVVARGAAKDIIKYNPNIDIIYDYKKGKEKELAKIIENEKYDVLIDFSEMLRVNMMKFISLSKVKINIGLDKINWNLFDVSVNNGEDFKLDEHITKRYGAYLSKLKIEEYSDKYDIYLGKELDKKIDGAEKENYKNIVLNPYGASKHKHFNEDSLKFIINSLNLIDSELKIRVILIYSPEKYSELKMFLEKNKDEFKNLKNIEIVLPEGIKSILDSAVIIKQSEGVITPDTSVVHIASAFNKKIISVYPPNGGLNKVDHLVWRPLDVENRMLFCSEPKTIGDVIDINSFNKNEMKNEILKRFG